MSAVCNVELRKGLLEPEPSWTDQRRHNLGVLFPAPTAMLAWGLTGLPSTVFPYPCPVTRIKEAFSCHRDVSGVVKIKAGEDITDLAL